MADLFMAEVYRVLQQGGEVGVQGDDGYNRWLDRIEAQFPRTAHYLEAAALALYHDNKYDQAKPYFEVSDQSTHVVLVPCLGSRVAALLTQQELRLNDPYRLDHMDLYANMLFVQEQKTALSHLAHQAVKIDKVPLRSVRSPALLLILLLLCALPCSLPCLHARSTTLLRASFSATTTLCAASTTRPWSASGARCV